jgi:hypothetical protein
MLRLLADERFLDGLPDSEMAAAPWSPKRLPVGFPVREFRPFPTTEV